MSQFISFDYIKGEKMNYTRASTQRALIFVFGLFLFSLMWVASYTPALAQEPGLEEADARCLSCHSDPDLIGTISPRKAELFEKIVPGGNYRIYQSSSSNKRELEVFHHFRPFRPRRG